MLAGAGSERWHQQLIMDKQQSIQIHHSLWTTRNGYPETWKILFQLAERSWTRNNQCQCSQKLKIAYLTHDMHIRAHTALKMTSSTCTLLYPCMQSSSLHHLNSSAVTAAHTASLFSTRFGRCLLYISSYHSGWLLFQHGRKTWFT